MKSFVFKIICFCLFISLFACQPSYDELLTNAKGLMNKGENVAAISLLNEAIKQNSQMAEAFNVRGAAFFAQSKFVEALTDFNQAIAIDSTQYKHFYNRGNAKRALRDWKGALKDYDKALELNNTQYDIYLNKGIVNRSLGELDNALSDFEMAEKLSNGKDANVLYYFGETLSKKMEFVSSQDEINTYKTKSCDKLNKSVQLGNELAKELKTKICQ
jgi:tetratricopeptide (TPR) repeat protein